MRARGLLATWAKAIALLALARAASLFDPSGLLAGNLAAVAAVLFILLPERAMSPRGETWGEQGFPWWGAADARTWRAWLVGAAQGVALCAVVFPAFAALWWGCADWAPRLPHGIGRLVAPYAVPVRFAPRLPRGFALLAATQLLVVALPEELFYRGYLQTSWRRTNPSRRRRVLGADLGEGFVRTQLLFALGHLITLQPWRVATFFPGLLFGWTRERTGSLAAPVVVHALSNLFLAVLEASFLGAR